MPPCRRRQGAGERRRAALHLGVAQGAAGGVAGEEQQLQAAAGRPRAQHGAEQAVGGDGGAQQFGLEHLAHEVGHCHRAPSEQPPRIISREGAEGRERAHRRPGIVRGRPVDVRRRAREDDGRRRRAGRVTARSRASDPRPEPTTGEWPRPRQRVGVDGQRAAIRRQGRHAHRPRDERHAVVGEPQLLDDIGADGAGAVGERRHAEARRQLVLGGASADPGPPLEQQRPEPGLAEQRRARQPVDPAANHDGVVLSDSRLPSPASRHDRSIRSAAFLPGAPMMPPPGCVADPHM